MTKGEKLIWDLFMKLREFIPPSPENTEWASKWAMVFHEMEHPEPPAPPPETAAPAEDPETVDDEPAEDPHEHDVPPRKPRKKR